MLRTSALRRVSFTSLYVMALSFAFVCFQFCLFFFQCTKKHISSFSTHPISQIYSTVFFFFIFHSTVFITLRRVAFDRSTRNVSTQNNRKSNRNANRSLHVLCANLDVTCDAEKSSNYFYLVFSIFQSDLISNLFNKKNKNKK